MSTAQARRIEHRKPAVMPAARRNPQAEADYLRGLALTKKDLWAQAADAFASAAARNPDDAVFWLNLAHARVKLGDLENAADAARRAAVLDPKSEIAISIASQCLAAGNRHEETIELLRGLDLANVRNPNPHFALGEALAAVHRYREAIDAYLAALGRKPDFLPAHVHLANVFERVSLHLEARECLQTAIALGDTRASLYSAMAYHAQHACRWDLFAQDYAKLEQELATGRGQPVPFHLLTMPSSRQQQRAAGYAYWAERCKDVLPLPKAGPRTLGSRIRIGYVSNDIFRHATAYLIGDLLESHDRSRFDIFLYSYGHDDGSDIRKRIIAAAGERFIEASRMSDAELAERVRSDDIDILVDLKGYTLGTRIGIFARHPARVQVNFLGYPGTLGAPCYEYIVGDRIVTPLEHADDYSEKIAQMPHCYQPNDRRRPIGRRPTRAECGLPETGFVFCSFNNCYKITEPVFDRWCRLLRAVEGSVLWLYEANAQARPNLLREAQARGIAPERIVWAPHADLADHLGRLQLADLVLDTLPVNAHTTASDALWAGVPMVTTAGESFVARVASSVLHAAGLGELIAADGDAYEHLALALAGDPARLQRLREQLVAGRDHCALFDSQAHTRDLELLYDRMLERWVRGEAPQHLPAAQAA
jgi:predicted O-linked N-acetylglucosamine transferase (SPINDLY family)